MNIQKELFKNTNLINLEENIFFIEKINSIILNDIDYYNHIFIKDYDTFEFDFYNSSTKPVKYYKVKETIINNLSIYTSVSTSSVAIYYIELFNIGYVDHPKINSVMEKLFKIFKQDYE